MNKKKINLHTPIWLNTKEIESNSAKSSFEKQTTNFKNTNYIRTTPGRIIINQTIQKNLYS